MAKVFLRKADSALSMLDSAVDKNETDWVITASYYAKYFSFYAILAKCGIKCEIHDCTIFAMRFLFVDTGIIAEDLYEDLNRSKELRVDMQYYPCSEAERKEAFALAKTAPDFVLKMQETCGKMHFAEIRRIRLMLDAI
ncbi:MAG: HEPN domain-containing protein [Nanoarchaeota archaeon]|nr:HEPN domain-containing protein [Nanoarchaeota archaeon]